MKKTFWKIGSVLLVGSCLFACGSNGSSSSPSESSKAPGVSGNREREDRDREDDESTRVSANLIAAHDRNSPQYNENCTDCHADILTAQSLDPSILNVHVAMRPFAPGEEDDDKCVSCHRTVDLTQGTQREEKSTGNLRKHVDAAYCTLCHGPSGPGKKFYEVDLDAVVTDGAELYDLICSGCHGDLADSEVSGESANEIREEIDDNEGGMGPLRVLSTAQIQAIADALAQGEGERDD